ncbi:MAG: hypothetical protein JOY58_08215 [Solirubrobacterales bacterium]|nr:hypothetical protein [Solirubrobacterales bacterium]
MTSNDERSTEAVLALRVESANPSVADAAALTPRVRALVRLAALFAVDAPTSSLRWAVELASCAGADDDDIVGVLVTVGSDIGLAQVVSIAPRLALAIGYDIEMQGWNGL